MCNGRSNCGWGDDGEGDHSDEDPTLCGVKNVTKDVSSRGRPCHANEFPCKVRRARCTISLSQLRPTCHFFKDESTCLPLSLFCDHRVDCDDNSDEGPFCALRESACHKMGCSGPCTVTHKGPTCYCNEGEVMDGRGECRESRKCKVKIIMAQSTPELPFTISFLIICSLQVTRSTAAES